MLDQRDRPADAEPELPDGAQYELLSVLGEGGSGRVFKARDRVLDRLVAFKVLRGDVALLQKRFLREARAQARVVHDHVCRVYEVGRTPQGPFIAMQLVEGKPLHLAARELHLRDRLAVFCDVAEAIEAAHRTGLLHRDLKPANVLVERRGERWHAYVTDFGLARDLLGPASTVEGSLLGSPLYMSPEQAQGGADLDARADVYALGVTLYELLVGRPPFLSESGLQVLYRTLHEQPTAPRKLDRSIPAGLERVVLQTLEKARDRRYPSAQALADDVHRHLRGEAVRARRYGAAHRFRNLVARSPALSLLVATAAVLAVALVVSRWSAARREQVSTAAARSFGERVRSAEATVRMGALLPLHDVRREREEVKAQIAAIERQMSGLDPESAALGHAAIGRAWLGLRDPVRARDHLERALQAGRASPQDRYALGLALGGLYARELARGQRAGGAKERKARAQALDAELRAPALVHLRAAGGAGVQQAPDYVEALIAHYERRHGDALDKARAAFAAVPDLYEAKKLEGDALIARALASSTNDQRDRAVADFEAAGAAYAVAAEIGRSDPTVHEAECRRQLLIVQTGIAVGVSPYMAAEAGSAACGRALAADPDGNQPRHLSARIRFRLAEWRAGHGEDPRADVLAALTLSRAALERDGRDLEALRHVGQAHHALAIHQARMGIDPRPSFQQAVAAEEQALRLEPRYAEVFNAMGAASTVVAAWEAAHGSDPGPTLREAESRLRRAIEMAGEHYGASVNLGTAAGTRARWLMDHGLDATAAIDAIEEANREAQKKFPASPDVATGFCTAALLRALQLGHTGIDPIASFERGRKSCASAIRPGAAAEAFCARAELAAAAAAALVDRGRDPGAALREAEEAAAEALLLDAGNPEALRLRADASVVRGRWALRTLRAPGPLFDTAERDLRRAIDSGPAHDLAHRSLARLHAARIEWRRQRGEGALAERRRALADVQRALSLRPRWPELLAFQASLSGTREPPAAR